MTEEEYNFKYRKNKIDYFFHCYYNKETPDKILKYKIIKTKLLIELDGWKTRVNSNTGTTFKYISYKDVPSGLLV